MGPLRDVAERDGRCRRRGNGRRGRRWRGRRGRRELGYNRGTMRWRRVLRLRVLPLLSFLAVVAVGALASGCAPVAPYERGKLAHPTMSAGTLATMGEDHL